MSELTRKGSAAEDEFLHVATVEYLAKIAAYTATMPMAAGVDPSLRRITDLKEQAYMACQSVVRHLANQIETVDEAVEIFFGAANGVGNPIGHQELEHVPLLVEAVRLGLLFGIGEGAEAGRGPSDAPGIDA